MGGGQQGMNSGRDLRVALVLLVMFAGSAVIVAVGSALWPPSALVLLALGIVVVVGGPVVALYQSRRGGGPVRASAPQRYSGLLVWVGFVALHKAFEPHLGPTGGLLAAFGAVIPVLCVAALWQDHRPRSSGRVGGGKPGA
jgi:peptidoglycan/LPS O-acetylase OafA/YrhL